jgi:hypothetical protein
MFPILRQHWTLWAAWMLVSSGLLFANPWLTFSWAELAACVGSLVLAIAPRTRRETLLAAGLPAITVFCLLDGGGISIARFALDWFVFIGGVILGARAVDDQRELEAIAGHLALGEDPVQATPQFLNAVESEISRARRHDRAFVLLSIAPHPRSLATKPTGEGRILRKLAEARWVLELSDLLKNELHRYAHVLPSYERVLCVVPELEDGSVDALTKRIADAALRSRGVEIEIGVARYPHDALAVDDLIEFADGDRPRPTLESVPAPPKRRIATAEDSRSDAKC